MLWEKNICVNKSLERASLFSSYTDDTHTFFKAKSVSSVRIAVMLAQLANVCSSTLANLTHTFLYTPSFVIFIPSRIQLIFDMTITAKVCMLSWIRFRFCGIQFEFHWRKNLLSIFLSAFSKVKSHLAIFNCHPQSARNS